MRFHPSLYQRTFLATQPRIYDHQPLRNSIWDRVLSSPPDFQCYLALHLLASMKAKIIAKAADPKAVSLFLVSVRVRFDDSCLSR